MPGNQSAFYVTDLFNYDRYSNPRHFLTSTMELENHEFQAIVYYDLKRCLTYHESHKNLCEVFWSIAQGKSTVS